MGCHKDKDGNVTGELRGMKYDGHYSFKHFISDSHPGFYSEATTSYKRGKGHGIYINEVHGDPSNPDVSDCSLHIDGISVKLD